jgi:hypothetical protein
MTLSALPSTFDGKLLLPAALEPKSNPQKAGRRERNLQSNYSCLELTAVAVAFALFDHLVGSGQHVRRDRHADLLSRLQIDCELEFRRLLHGKIGGFCAFQNFVDIYGGAPE